MSWVWGAAGGAPAPAHAREDAADLRLGRDDGQMSRAEAGSTGLEPAPWLSPLTPLTPTPGHRRSSHPDIGREVDADGMKTVWTRAHRDRGPTQHDGGPASPESTSSISPSRSPEPVSASSSEANTSQAQPEAGGNRGNQSSARAVTPTAATSRRGQGRRGRRAPKRCRRCGRFLRKESWIRSLTRTVSKSLTHVPWGRRRECTGCFRPFRRVRARYGRGKVKTSRRSRSKSRKRRPVRRPRSRSNSRSQKGRSNKRRRRRRGRDDHEFFVC